MIERSLCGSIHVRPPDGLHQRSEGVWMPLIDGLPIALPETQHDLVAGTTHKHLRAPVVEGLWVDALNLAHAWSGGDWDAHTWDVALVSVPHPDEDPELLVLDRDETEAWCACLMALSRVSEGQFRAADLEKGES